MRNLRSKKVRLIETESGEVVARGAVGGRSRRDWSTAYKLSTIRWVRFGDLMDNVTVVGHSVLCS